MCDIKPSILKMFKNADINIFNLTEEERANKIKEFEAIKKQERKQKVDAYNKKFYAERKDYFENYYKTNCDKIALKSKEKYIMKKMNN